MIGLGAYTMFYEACDVRTSFFCSKEGGDARPRALERRSRNRSAADAPGARGHIRRNPRAKRMEVSTKRGTSPIFAISARPSSVMRVTVATCAEA